MHRAAARRRKSCGNECTLTLRAGAWARHASSAADVILLRASRSSLRWVSEDQWQAPRPTASMPLPSRVISLAAVQRSKSTSVTMALSLCAANTDSIPRGHNLSKDAERTSTYTPLLWSPHTSTHPPTHPSRPIRTAVPIAPIPQTCRIQRPNSPTATSPSLAKGPPNNSKQRQQQQHARMLWCTGSPSTRGPLTSNSSCAAGKWASPAVDVSLLPVTSSRRRDGRGPRPSKELTSLPVQGRHVRNEPRCPDSETSPRGSSSVGHNWH